VDYARYTRIIHRRPCCNLLLGPFHTDANYSRERSRCTVVLAWVFTLTRMFARIVRANSSRRSLCQMQFARTTCGWSQFSTNILHTDSGRSEVVSKIKNTLAWTTYFPGFSQFRYAYLHKSMLVSQQFV